MGALHHVINSAQVKKIMDIINEILHTKIKCYQCSFLNCITGKPDFPLVQRLAQKSLPFLPLLYLFQTDKLIEMLS